MVSKLEIHDRLVVGFRNYKEDDLNPLVFMTYDGGNGLSKRMETLRSWCGGRHYGYVDGIWTLIEENEPNIKTIDNSPVVGFKIKDWTSRSTTDNKLFDISDPRGFTIQVYIDNFFEMIQNDICDHGLFAGEYVWGRKDAKNWLVSTSNPVFHEARGRKETRETVGWIAPKVGDWIEGSDGYTNGKYFGKVWAVTYDYSYDYGYAYRYREAITPTYTVSITRDQKPWEMIVSLSSHSKFNVYFKRKFTKNDIVSPAKEEISFDPPYGDYTTLEEYYNHSSGQGCVAFIFKTKEEMMNASIETIKDQITKYLTRNAKKNNVIFK